MTNKKSNVIGLSLKNWRLINFLFKSILLISLIILVPFGCQDPIDDKTPPDPNPCNDFWTTPNGHNTDTGSGFGYKANLKNITSPDGSHVSRCFGVKDEIATIDYDFYLTINTSQVQAHGEVDASFKIFKDNDLVDPTTFTIAVQSGQTVDKQEIKIMPADYTTFQNNTSIVNFNIKSTFSVVPVDLHNADYSIVFSIDDKSGIAANHVESGLIATSCTSFPDTTLQYFQCIDMGNTHQKYHITIETMPLCESR